MFDWVVVGSGAGSMSSALQMRAAGMSVVILEKAPWVGGTTCKSGGVMWIPVNPFMRGGEDSPEKAIAYLDAVVGEDPDAPGTSREHRRRYVDEAPQMVRFLLDQGIALERCSQYWPDYYDELPGGCKTSRTVAAKPFNKKELGDWAPRLRQGFLAVPVRLEDGMMLPFMKHSWKIKWTFLKIAFAVAAGKLTGKQWVTAGAALQGRMLQAALKAKVDIRVDSQVAEIVLDSGVASGVVTRKAGKPWRIGARLGVLINAGGFSQNQSMRDRYQPGTRVEWSNGIESDTGDMHVELERLGAVLGQMDQFVGCPTTLDPGSEKSYVKSPIQSVTCKPHAILVDRSGVRYMNEGGSYELYCETMLVRDRTVPAVPSLAILDANYMASYALANKPGGKRIPQAWIDACYIKQADTIEGLAVLIGVEPATLHATIDRWNGFVDNGADTDFGRGARAYDNWLGDPFFTDGPNQCMGRIDRAPFYAVEVLPGDVGTFGGVLIDENARVKRADGEPIEGLYACGVATASIMGRVYPGAGASVGPSMCFGWIAARHALAFRQPDPVSAR
jgi:3-oxosteroid 1-dehydrogenase